MKENRSIKDIQKDMNKLIKEMREIWNNGSLREMQEVMDYTRLLNCTDFQKTITD